MSVLPLPKRIDVPEHFELGQTRLRIDFSKLPERPRGQADPASEEHQRGHALMERVNAVWARIREVEETLADPASIWSRLAQIWLNGDAARPEMDVIVRHALALPPVLDHLERGLRRILRRTARMMPLARVQEMDRKAMLWLARQPGETLAERAGDRQRVQAVAREENFDTLENRVLLSYSRLGGEVAREYEERNRRSAYSPRVRLVRGFGLRCRAMERELLSRGVRIADLDVTPNFVLQNNWHYHQVWTAWLELLKRHREVDMLWQWQARSWEEFCALAIIVAVQTIPGAQPVAVSPIAFRDEQERGCWIRHRNPIAVFHLPEQQRILEISFRQFVKAEAGVRTPLAGFGACIWLRTGLIGSESFLSRWPIWPMWSADGGLEVGEAGQVSAILAKARVQHQGAGRPVTGGIVMRPVGKGGTTTDEAASVTAVTLGVAGIALSEGISNAREAVIRLLASEEG